MKNNKLFILVSLVLVCLSIYLFKTAPEVLDDGQNKHVYAGFGGDHAGGGLVWRR